MEAVLPKDLAQDAGLAKRRHAELCRQNRVFNARNRIIGGNPAAWSAQVHDQRIKEATEKARHETFAAEMKQNDKIMCILEDRERRDRKNLCRAINNFQQSFQKPETRREFDLSDPLALKKDLPARQADNDTRNTVSGMQKFMGEDLNFHDRKKFQEEQNREWCLQQQREWRNACAGRRCADLGISRKEETREEAGTGRQPGRDLQLASWGLALREPAAGSQLLWAPPRGSRPLEGHDPRTAGADPPGPETASPGEAGACPSPSHRSQWAPIYLVPCPSIQRLQEEERQRDMDWARRSIQGARATLLFERQQQRQQRDLRRAQDNCNFSLAREQGKKCMEEVYASQPTEDYFTQFNTRSR